MPSHSFYSRRGLHAALVAAICASVAMPATAQVANVKTPDAPQTFGNWGPVADAADAVPVALPSKTATMSWRHQPSVYLGEVDVEALLAEDAAKTEMRSLQRVGILRDTLIRDAQGRWINTKNGRLWTTDVISEGSLGTRLHLIGMNLPEGAELFIYNPADKSQVDGPITSAGRFGNGEMWSKTIWSDVVRIEYFVPKAIADEHGDDVPFVVSELSHWYRPLDGEGRGVGACHNDVTCYPDWANVAAATGLLSFIDGGSFVCTGELIDTQASDLTPYFYTANHCIPNNTVAQTAEIFWFYQSAVCDGPPSFSSSNSVCTFIGGNATLDYTLMMIHDQLPGGLFWVGWTSAVPSNGAAAVCVHHPGGTYKRISFGNRFNSSVCGFGGATNYHRLSWVLPDGGVVEPGSSGSGIYLADTQQIFGNLFCGTSSCSVPSNDDDFHRFDRVYVQNNPDVSALLVAGSDDSFENNDTCETAAPIGAGTYNEPLIVKSTDEDWYAITLSQGQRLEVIVNFIDSHGDIDIELHDSCVGRTVVRSSTSNTNNESFIYTEGSGLNTYYLRVFMDETDTRAEYSMTIAITQANDTCGSGVQAQEGSTPFTTNGTQTDGPDAPGSCGFPDNNQMENDIWYTFIAPCTDTVTISICDADFQPRLSVFFVVCPFATGNPDPLVCNEGGCPGGAEVSFAANQGSTYQIRIASKNGITGSGTLEIVCGAPPSCPADITDAGGTGPDGAVDVFDLLELLANWNTNGNGAAISSDGGGENLVDVFDLLALLDAWGSC